jgi:hypothetical protein
MSSEKHLKNIQKRIKIKFIIIIYLFELNYILYILNKNEII